MDRGRLEQVMPELTRQKRSDQESCIGCHGKPGRVPSMQLKAPDKFGYLSVADLLVNYRTLQQRVNLTALEKSKFLRKPLNIQDGTEDGHQGGRRYTTNDPGYLVLKKWVDSQPMVQRVASAGTNQNQKTTLDERTVKSVREGIQIWRSGKLVSG